MTVYTNTINGTVGAHFGYDPQNRRIWQWNAADYQPFNQSPAGYTNYFYGVNGQRLASYTLTATPTWQGSTIVNMSMTSSVARQDLYLAGRRVSMLDRLGSIAGQNIGFYPYGEDKGSANPSNDSWKRDSATGLDYAMNRYYSSGLGSFLSPDRSARSSSPGNPQSWNKYAYVRDDPANFSDPTGR